MSTNESLMLIAGVAFLAYTLGVQHASRRQASDTVAAVQNDPLGWLGAWAQ